MIKVVIAVDEKDKQLGDYFASCKQYFIAAINSIDEISSEISEISARNCRKEYLDITLSHLKEVPFIMVAYMHGNEKQLIANGGVFLQVGNDNSYFKDTLFYTNSCSCGKYLGPDLIRYKCSAFIGYDQKVDVFLEDHREISIKCDNFGIIAFLTQNITAHEAYEQMHTNYSIEVNKMRSFGNILGASVLVNARESLVFHGNKELKKEELIIK